MTEPIPFDRIISDKAAMPPVAGAEPSLFYNRHGDTLQIYLKQRRYVAERVSSVLTIFVAEDDRNEIVGLAIKNIKKHFGASAPLWLALETGKRRGKASVKLFVLGALFSQQLNFLREGEDEFVMPLDREQLIRRALDELGDAQLDMSQTDLGA